VSTADYKTRAAQTYQYIPSGAATTLTADGIIALFYSLRVPYRQDATWVTSSDTARQVRQPKDGEGEYIWVPGVAAANEQLLGKPVVIDENVPSVAAGSYPIAVARGHLGLAY
jgi:HK97 family phage major capsid protein